MKHILTLVTFVFATSCFGQEACQSDLDINANGAVDIADFLHVLGLFGDVDSDGDGVWDSQDLCTNPDACNYEASPTEPCQILDAIGVCGGYCETDEDQDGVCDVHDCGQPLTYQGYSYETVQIGGQCWFAENLRSELYLNGDSISTELWDYAESGRVAVYGEGGYNCSSSVPNGDACDEVWAFEAFGRMYNGHAINDGRGLCPYGWRVPTNSDWSSLENWVEGDGSKLKALSGWHNDGNGNNETGFNAYPGGARFGNGYWINAGVSGCWWSSNTTGGGSNYRRCLNTSDNFDFGSFGYTAGFSVRCIQDSE